MTSQNMLEGFNNEDDEISMQIIDQLADRFKISSNRIKIYNIMYDFENKILDFELEIMDVNKDEMSSKLVYEQINNLIKAHNFNLKINGNFVSIDKIRKSMNVPEKYSDPSQYEPKDFKNNIGYLENAIRGFREEKKLINFWQINPKTGKLELPVLPEEEEIPE
jgi:hypothetical protein